MNLGSIKTPLDLRDIKLDKVQAPVLIPSSYKTDISKIPWLWQGHLPVCYAHAGAFLKDIQETIEAGTPQSFSPRYTCIKVKQFDGYPLEQGSDMRSVFKSLAKDGALDVSLMPNDVSLDLQTYATGMITSEMDANAQPRIISSYAFAGTDFNSVKQAIYQNKAVLIDLLVNTEDNNWWGSLFSKFDPKLSNSGHLIVGYGYDDSYINIICSADNNIYLKQLDSNYPLRKVGTCVDLLDSVVKEQIARLAWLQKVVVLWRKVVQLTKSLNK